jgi:multimeric flavodoxin WrbA
MSQKILILNGSPRKKGNTATLVEAFTRGAESSGHSVTTYNVDAMNIHPCKGCLCGGKDPSSPCSQKDAMDQIYPVYRDADIVVLASPLYYDSVTAQLKAAFDRLFAVSEGNPGYQTPAKKSALLMVAGDNDFSLVTHWYDHLLEHLAWEKLGQVLCGYALNLGDIDGRPEIMDAENLGRSIL